MKKYIYISKLLVMAVAFSGCTESYRVAGLFEAGGEAFHGAVQVGMGQAGTIEVATADGRVTCTGASQITKFPSGYTYIGAQGRAQATCSDGRTFKIDFIQSTETGGRGQGIDSQGNIVQLYFDMSDDLARSMLEKHLVHTLIQ